jgi:hypothetical protein
MRMMLRAQLGVDSGSRAIAEGSIVAVFDEVFGICRPEATYFLTDRGLRTVYAIFDMKTPDIIPQIAEPLFQGLGATVEFMPAMTQAELAAGLQAWAGGR